MFYDPRKQLEYLNCNFYTLGRLIFCDMLLLTPVFQIVCAHGTKFPVWVYHLERQVLLIAFL